MDEETKPKESSETETFRTRSMLLTMLCLGSFVYFGIISLIFLAALFNTGRIAVVMNQYIPPGADSKSQVLFATITGFALHGLAFYGILRIWKLRKTGYYLLGVSCLVMASYQLLNPAAAVASAAIYIIFIILFGIFYRGMR